MKANIKEDLIIQIVSTGGVEIGRIPVGVDLSRLRFDGSKVVDLATLTSFWVKYNNGRFDLHCIEVPNSQLVDMIYEDRKNLIYQDGIIRVKTQEEINQDKINLYNSLLKNRLRTRLKNNIGDTADLLADMSKLVFLLIIYSRTNNARIATAFDRLIPIIRDVYSIDDIEEGLLDVASFLKNEMPKYYSDKK